MTEGMEYLRKGREKMGRFNLIHEPWISVMDEESKVSDVSLKELFSRAHEISDLGGDTKTQDFSVLRVLLAVLHTVFSRVDASGNSYEYLELDEKMRPKEPLLDSYLEDYEYDLEETWRQLWQKKQFPDVVAQYLHLWEEHFFLFDKEYPFFQCNKEIFDGFLDVNGTKGQVLGKNINRTISESANKVALFAPKSPDQKEYLTDSEIARWVLTYHDYTGTGDKASFLKDNPKLNGVRVSKGWLFDLGGVYLKGKNLFETLMLNLVLIPENRNYLLFTQEPCWEFSSRQVIDRSLSNVPINNLAALYTVWSRAIYINPDRAENSPFVLISVKIPEVTHTNMFLEPMTLWRYNLSGKNKGDFTPVKHQKYKSLWRSFGLLTLDSNGSGKEDQKHKPGIIHWFMRLRALFKEWEEDFSRIHVSIASVSMEDDGNETSRVPTDEVIDELHIDDLVITDQGDEGWLVHINDTISLTKKVVEFTYKKFIDNIYEIRNIKDRQTLMNQQIEKAYFFIDGPFTTWLESIRPTDQKLERVEDWKIELKKIVKQLAQEQVEQGNPRDFIGIVKEDQVLNIATAFNTFMHFLNLELKTQQE